MTLVIKMMPINAGFLNGNQGVNLSQDEDERTLTLIQGFAQLRRVKVLLFYPVNSLNFIIAFSRMKGIPHEKLIF